MLQQSTSHILMVEPACFAGNLETMDSNRFQNTLNMTPAEAQENALDEFQQFVETLKTHQIDVTVIKDTAHPHKPDAVFPNNWFSIHHNGSCYLYPMMAENRRLERRPEIIDTLKHHFEITAIKDISMFEKDNLFLEGTGSIVFDHVAKIAYACLSPRTNAQLLERLAIELGYAPVTFKAVDANGYEIYHTNVLMCVGTGFVVICMDAIRDLADKQKLMTLFKETGLEVITIRLDQMNQFAGNMLELQSNLDVDHSQGKHFIVMSQTAWNSLEQHQIERLQCFGQLLPVSIPTIETLGGGSARCMMAEIFAPLK